MRRSNALAPLSRDHHQALETALRLRRATGDDAEAALKRLRAFWAQVGRRHFEIEEALLLPAVPDSDERWAAMAARVRAEHADIRERAAALEQGPPGGDALVSAVRALGERLNDHVRFEERELFVHLEGTLDEVTLERLGHAVQAAEAAQ